MFPSARTFGGGLRLPDFMPESARSQPRWAGAAFVPSFVWKLNFFLLLTPIVDDASGIADVYEAVLQGTRVLVDQEGCVPCSKTWSFACIALGPKRELPIDLGLLHSGHFHEVMEVLVHFLGLRLARLRDGSKHYGRCDHILCGIEKVLCVVTALSELVTYLLWQNLPCYQGHMHLFSFQRP